MNGLQIYAMLYFLTEICVAGYVIGRAAENDDTRSALGLMTIVAILQLPLAAAIFGWLQ